MDEDECPECPDWHDTARAIHDLCATAEECETVSASPLSMLLVVMALHAENKRLLRGNEALYERIEDLETTEMAE